MSNRAATRVSTGRLPGLSAGFPALSKAVGLTLALGSSHSLAQEGSHPDRGPPADSNTRSEESAAQLDKVNVYGDELTPSSPKFTAPLVDTPQSITIIPRSLMQQTAATSLQDALRNVPGITFGAGEGGNPIGDRPSIRGFNSTASTYVDGMRDISIQTRDIFALDQVEVIKGPDSSVAGRSAGGGSINLVTKTAQASNFIEATGSYGSAQQYRAAIDGNVKLTDNIAARLNVMHMGGGVPGRDEAVRTDKTGIAPTITFGLESPTRIVLSYYRLQDRGTPDFGVPVDLTTGLPITATQPVSRNNFYGLKDRDFRNAVINATSASLEHSFGGDVTLRSQLRYTQNTNDYLVTSPDDAFGNTLNGLVYRLPLGRRARDDAWISQTDFFGHVQTGTIRHDFDMGIELSQEKLKQAGNGNYNGLLVTSTNGPQGFGTENCYTPGDPNYPVVLGSFDCTSLYRPNPRDHWTGSVTVNPSNTYFTTRNGAAYAFDTVTLTPHWKINAGLRWDDYNTKTRTPDKPDNDASDHLTFVSYKASLIYKPTEAGTIYLTSSSASLPQALAFSDQDGATAGSPFSPTTSTIGPVKTQLVELGTKWNFLANRLLLSGAAFSETARDAAIQVTPDTWVAAGETQTRGVELSANGMLSETWNLTAGYSFLDGKLLKGSYSDSSVGKQLVDTPRNTFSLFSTYQVSHAVVVGGGAYYRDRQVGYYGTPDRYIPSYWRVDAMAQWHANEHVELQMNVQNLFDKDYYTKDYYQFALPAAGRSWLLSATLRF